MNGLTFKNILVWRHADAEIARADGDDMGRALTQKGVNQAKSVAKWLNKHMAKQTIVYVSPALRALQTVEALQFPTQTLDALKPEATLEEILSALDNVGSAEHILLVGHQPWIGQLITYLLGLGTQGMSVKKGALWWLRLGSREVSKYQVLTVQTPQLFN